jgi:carbon-monoxide dehydrogenase medium subunit
VLPISGNQENTMASVEYHRPATLDDATALLAQLGSSSVLAGGTDLLVQMRSGRLEPRAIVDIKDVPGITSTDLGPDGLYLGAAAPAQSITERSDVAALYPGLVEATDLIGSTQIQGRCSIGGNLCNASPAADTVPALIVNNATCRIAGIGGERRVAVTDFTTGPGSNCLQPGEFLLGLEIPRPPPRTADAYLRFIPRTEMDIAVVGAAVSLSLAEDGSCNSACVAIGAVAPTALDVVEAAACLVGTSLDDEALDAMADAVRAAASPISDMRGSADFRRHVVGVLARRAAVIAMTRAREISV